MVKHWLISAIVTERLLMQTNRTPIGVAHVIFYTITSYYGKQVTVFAAAIAVGDSVLVSNIKSLCEWEIHLRYNNMIIYVNHQGLCKTDLYSIIIVL